MVGAVAIAALPPLNGFVSEWLMYLSLMKCGLRDQRRPQPDGPAGRRPPGPDRRPGRDRLRSPDGHRAAGFAAERSRPARARVLAVDARADAGPGLPVPDRGGRPADGRRLAVRACWIRFSARKPVEPCSDLESVGGTARHPRQRQRLDAHCRRGGGGRRFWSWSRKAARAEGPTWGCGYVKPTVRMQYTGRSFAEMIAEHLLPRFLRPRTTRQRPAGLVPFRERIRVGTALTRSARRCTSRSSGAGRSGSPGSASSSRGRFTSTWSTSCSWSFWPWPGCPLRRWWGTS